MPPYEVQRDNIGEWLLTSPVQISDGRHRGAVAGWLSADESPAFLYPEITGYYLTTMAYMASRNHSHRGDAARAAKKALTWLEMSFFDGQVPVTRVYPGPITEERDWRTLATFSFDIGMVLRGLIAVDDLLSPDPRRAALSARCTGLLEEFCRTEAPLEGMQMAPAADHGQVPSRWSTLPGPHHVKVAAGIAMLAPEQRQSRLLSDAAERTTTCWLQAYPFAGTLPPHPTFYFLEGLLQWAVIHDSETYLDHVGVIYGEVMRGWRSAPHGLKGNELWYRSDVVAQALRIGCVLAALNRGGVGARECDDLAALLSEFIDEDGSVRFATSAPGAAVHRNAWSAMFAFQALDFYVSYSSSGEISSTDILQLI